MRSRFLKQALTCVVLPGITWLAATAWPVLGQDVVSTGQRYYVPCPPPPCPPGPTGTMPSPFPALQPGVTGEQPGEQTPSPLTPETTPSFSPERSVALGGSTVARSAVGYIDSAIPMSQFRLRFDAAYDDNRPDRAEFLYPKCGCFSGAPGPPLPEKSIDFQELYSYLEYAFNPRFSAFLEVPVRFLNPEVNKDTTGLSDMDFGVKSALIASPEEYLTFQFTTFVPTGEPHLGLGTGHVSLEPALLLNQRLADRLYFEAEFRDWIPVGGTDFAGNVVRYGAGVSYDIYQTPQWTLAPVLELVGWTVLSGHEASPDINTPDTTKSASGDTIVNVKIGARLFFHGASSIYVGYGRALTGDVWYKDILRAELRWVF